jgi:2-keto-4-pentenoate hydratase/2-oxohepta-3-ene-1,7-dioic acid hydratase in catechol pathway
MDLPPALITFEIDGASRIGLARGDHLHDVTAELEALGARSVGEVLRRWPDLEARLATLGAAAPPVPSRAVPRAPFVPGTIYCAGANYVDHVAEMARVMNQPVPPGARDAGEEPWFFIKATSTVVGPGATVARPRGSARVDYEIELAVVIGVAAKDVPASRALEHVAGYTIGNDLSVRDVGRSRTPVGSPFHYDWVSMKSFDGACPLGPSLVPARYVPDPQNLALELWVNDDARQSSSTGQMIFGVAEQIAWLSSRVTLHPGDVILTGTPAGVGMATGRFLRAGDDVRVRIERLGEMTQTIA